MTPLDVIDKAVRDNLPVVIYTPQRSYIGRALHIGPNSVWIVVENSDLFIPLSAIRSASLVPATPEGTQ